VLSETSYTATANASLNAYSAPSASQTPAWTLPFQWNSSSRSSTATSTTSTSRTKQ
jgi:hypothetical protein